MAPGSADGPPLLGRPSLLSSSHSHVLPLGAGSAIPPSENPFLTLQAGSAPSTPSLTGPREDERPSEGALRHQTDWGSNASFWHLGQLINFPGPQGPCRSQAEGELRPTEGRPWDVGGRD